MLKLAIVLCAAFFASAANASIWSDELENAIETATKEIDVAFFVVDVNFGSSDNSTYAAGNKTIDYALKMWEDVSFIRDFLAKDNISSEMLSKCNSTVDNIMDTIWMELENIDSDFKNCLKNVVSVKETVKAIFCIKEVAARATWFSIKMFQDLLALKFKPGVCSLTDSPTARPSTNLPKEDKNEEDEQSVTIY